jgi:hypothetical protein
MRVSDGRGKGTYVYESMSTLRHIERCIGQAMQRGPGVLAVWWKSCDSIANDSSLHFPKQR